MFNWIKIAGNKTMFPKSSITIWTTIGYWPGIVLTLFGEKINIAGKKST
jgi:hypothetical protein